VDGPWEAYLPKESESRDQARPARQRGSGRYACAHRSQRRGANASSHDDWRVVDRRDRAGRCPADARRGAEVAAYIAAHTDQLDADGRRLVVRNGHAVPRQVLTSSGAVEVAAPRVNDKRVDEAGERRRFASVILPAWCRKSPKITEVLPLLYLHGLSSSDFVPALEGFLGTGSGLSAPSITPADRPVAGRSEDVRPP